MVYIVVKFHMPNCNTFWDMNLFLVTASSKAMHMSPPCVKHRWAKENFGRRGAAGTTKYNFCSIEEYSPNLIIAALPKCKK